MSETTSLPTRARVVRHGEAKTYSFVPSDKLSFLFSGVPGQPEMFDGIGERGNSPPLHRHPWASWELVIEGQVRFSVDGEEHVLGPGDFIYTPPNAPHSYIIESERARMVGFNHPAGRFEDLQRKAAPLFQAEGGPDFEAVARLAAEHEVELLGPPLTL